MSIALFYLSAYQSLGIIEKEKEKMCSLRRTRVKSPIPSPGATEGLLLVAWGSTPARQSELMVASTSRRYLGHGWRGSELLVVGGGRGELLVRGGGLGELMVQGGGLRVL
jgi:hypothetical protein